MKAWILIGVTGAALAALGAGCGEGDSGIERVRDGVVGQDVAEGVDTLPAPSCAGDGECDDGLACTVDRCDLAAASPHCVWTLAADACLVSDRCYASGEASTRTACLACDPTRDRFALSAVTDGAACDDGDKCVQNATCVAGACRGEAVTCGDLDGPCAVAFCDPAIGCGSDPLDGIPCDDLDPCTAVDACVEGVCVGAGETCDDGDPCTDDACDTAGCHHTPHVGACDDGNPCTVGETCQADGVCGGGEADACDDDNVCTIDLCDDDVGCVHLPTETPCCVGSSSVCDDGNPCTRDLCDPLTAACSHELAANEPCDDQNACTVGDACVEGQCRGGVRDCDDGNPCTNDACTPAVGCVHDPATGGGCDDGLACSTGDTCQQGICRGDTSECACTPTLAADGVKFTTVLLGDGGHVGEALDVDLDATTCAPSSSCDGGYDNTLGLLASFANDPIAGAVEDGGLTLVATFDSAAVGAVNVSIFQAGLAGTNSGCDIQTQTCDWLVDRSFLDPATCEPVVALAGTRTAGKIVAGGPGSVLPFAIPLSDTASLQLTVVNVRLELTVTVTGGQVSAAQGVLGGAVPKSQLLDAVAALPDGSLPAPLTKETVTGLIQALVQNDIDSDGDGVMDAASIGIKLVARDANVVGAQ
ncbi:MAG: hypothetical protein KC635_05575 [Myxococcales bacterium]|nr:hypothetical protein [Myxococcales bacterium]